MRRWPLTQAGHSTGGGHHRLSAWRSSEKEVCPRKAIQFSRRESSKGITLSTQAYPGTHPKETRQVTDMGAVPLPYPAVHSGGSYPCLENAMGGGAWWATVHGAAELDTTERLHFTILYIGHIYTQLGT